MNKIASWWKSLRLIDRRVLLGMAVAIAIAAVLTTCNYPWADGRPPSHYSLF